MVAWTHKPVVMGIVQFGWFNSIKVLQNAKNLQILEQDYEDPEKWAQLLLKTEAGSRLKKVFKSKFDRILWRMANPGQRAETLRPDDPDFSKPHLWEIVTNYDPEFVLLFGTSAQHGFRSHISAVPFIGSYYECDHPASQGSLTALTSAAFWLNQQLDKHQLTL